MKDGRLNKCKECSKSDIRANRISNIEHYKKYDRDRGNRQAVGYLKKYREDNPKKYRAHSMVNYAVKSGKLKKMNCETCGQVEAHAHHDDYNYPLSVRWLCASHHKQWHAKNGEALNG